MNRRGFIGSTVAAGAAAALPRRDLFAQLYRPASPASADVVAVTGDGREVTLTTSALADLRAKLRGRLLLAEDDGYDQARRILNPTFDKRPALIAQVTGVADVRTAVDFARDNGGLLLAVKCGGHSLSGQSTCDRGMIIDLSPFRSVHVDPQARRAQVTGGSLLGSVDHEAMAFGLVTPLGTVSHTGVGGLVTGGGFGRLARRFGLAIDNLESVEVVSADGQLRHASSSENADLFWGVRGGGGNFGVVTQFEFRLHPMQRQVVAGRIVYPFARVRDVLNLYAEHAPRLPDELQVDMGILQPPGGAPGVAAFSICYSGRESEAERVIAPFRSLGPVSDTVQRMDYVAVQRSGDVDDPRATGLYTKSGFIRELSPQLISAILDNFQGDPARGTQVAFAANGGAISRIPANATAFSQRHVMADLLVFVFWRFGADPAPHVQWIRNYWTKLDPFTDGFYVNGTPDDATAATIQANYRQNAARMVAVKNQYDPKNLFRLNANIRPTV